ncbi:YusW family protein [Virgibacillus indicus]|nr:YusW family protein [Virgibacillus indicus]
MTIIMKRLCPLLFAALILGACGNDDEVENPPQNETDDTQQQDTNNDDSNSDSNSDANNDNDNTDSNAALDYSFTGFDLEADFNETNDTLDVDYDHENDETEASYENKSQNINLQGDAAMEELDKLFSAFDFDENTANEDVLKAVSEAFGIPDDATNVELDIEFSSGTEKEYKR